VVVFAAALLAVIGHGTISASIVGLAISYALQVCNNNNNNNDRLTAFDPGQPG